MSKKKWTIYGAVAAAVIMTAFAAPALAQETSNDNASYEALQARLDAAEARISRLTKAKPSDLDKARAKEMKQLVRQVLADAETRTMLQAKDSPITLNFGGEIQTRWMYRDGGADDAKHGFDIRRAKLKLYGNVFENGAYKLSIESQDGDIALEDAWYKHSMGDFSLKVGQMKTHYLWEYDQSSSKTMAVDRSIVSRNFRQGRSQGIELGYEAGDFRLFGSYTDGFNSKNTDAFKANNTYAVAGRAEWDACDWFTLGAGVGSNDDGVGSYTTWTVDGHIHHGGFTFDGYYVWKNENDVDAWGSMLQAGYFVTDSIQPFARYEFGSAGEGLTDLSVATFGVNYHVNANVKWATDFGYAFNAVDGWNTGQTGWNTNAEEGEYLLRTMIQVTF